MRRLAMAGMVVLALAAVGRGAPDDSEPMVNGKPLSAWIAQLKDKDAQKRNEATQSISQLGIQARPALKALVPLLGDTDVGVRYNAAGALAAIGPDAVGPLKDALKDANADVRQTAAYGLGLLGPAAHDAADALAALLKDDKEALVRQAAAQSLGQLGPEVKSAVPALAAAVKDANPDVRAGGGGGAGRPRRRRRAAAAGAAEGQGRGRPRPGGVVAGLPAGRGQGRGPTADRSPQGQGSQRACGRRRERRIVRIGRQGRRQTVDRGDEG